MPVCKVCTKMFPPNYTETIEGSRPDVSGKLPQQCIFCKLGIGVVEREESKGSNKFVKYTKEQCVNDYKEFLNKLRHSKNVKEIMKKSDSFVGGIKV